MSKVRNEKKRKTILPMMIPGSYAAFSKNFSTKNPMIVENSPTNTGFFIFFSWLFRQAFLKSVMPPALRPKGLAEHPVLWKKRALSKENRLPLP